jgi:hypothetical protein
MRDLSHLNVYRVRLHGQIGDAQNGAFRLRSPKLGSSIHFHVIASAGAGWDHVSVSLKGQKRLPSWGEMCWIKDLFFEPFECVMQLHPPADDWIDNGEVLHLWRPHDDSIPRPPSDLIGFKSLSPREAEALAHSLRRA